MLTHPSRRADRPIVLLVLGALAAGWLVGLVGQRAIVEATNYLDVSPPLILLALALCLGAGGAVRLVAPDRRPRVGAFGGIAMAGSILVGYVGLAIAYRDRFEPGAGGETWFSLLLESWFWVGIPLVVSAGLGLLGWWLADLAARRLTRG